MTSPAARFSVWMITKLPPAVVANTLQIMLSVAWIGMGVGTILTIASPSVSGSVLPLWVRVEWAATFIFGGVTQIIALQRGSRMWERAGLASSGVACLTYSLALFSTGRPAGVVIGVVFVLFAAGYGIRVMASTAGAALRGGE